jgi:leucyl/phenylalanyl-tRNA--protein transferase
MSEIAFPDPQSHDFPEWILFGEYYYDARDIIGFGGELSIGNLRNAYRKGIFPWHIDNMPLPWFCPEKRAVLEFSELHIPASLAKAGRRALFSFTIDKAFDRVVKNCSKMRRPGQRGTWITPDFIRAYNELHNAGMAHSIEAWDQTGKLAGGLYGVDAGGVFCGESMFYTQPNASKLSLLFLIDHLKTRGSTWLDVQVMTPHMRALGAKEISRKSFLEKLKKTQDMKQELFTIRNY